MKLLLASRSGSRRRMLEAAGVPFEVRIADFDEEQAKARLRADGLDAAALAAALAAAKALAVDALALDTGPDVLVLGADQTLELDDGSMLDKAETREEALAQLATLSGRHHRLHAAAALAEDGRIVWAASETVTLTVRPLSAAFLEHYIEREADAVLGGVGSYRIEAMGVQLFERIEGDHFAILGLPLLPLLAYLRNRGVLPS
jgi:septum formation protein